MDLLIAFSELSRQTRLAEQTERPRSRTPAHRSQSEVGVRHSRPACLDHPDLAEVQAKVAAEVVLTVGAAGSRSFWHRAVPGGGTRRQAQGPPSTPLDAPTARPWRLSAPSSARYSSHRDASGEVARCCWQRGLQLTERPMRPPVRLLADQPSGHCCWVPRTTAQMLASSWLSGPCLRFRASGGGGRLQCEPVDHNPPPRFVCGVAPCPLPSTSRHVRLCPRGQSWRRRPPRVDPGPTAPLLGGVGVCQRGWAQHLVRHARTRYYPS